MSRLLTGTFGVLACGCLDYQFTVAKDAGGAQDDTGPLGVGDRYSIGDSGDAGEGGSSLFTGDTASGPDPDVCERAENLTAYLDRFQVPDDGHVLYCHGTGGGGFVLVDSNISSCFPHLDHRWDVFPSTGCDS